MKQIVPSVKGTRDYYPEDMSVRSWLYQVVRKVSESFGYQEYEGPFLEVLDLYAAKSSEELVKRQSYSFQDRGGDWITLRPELTPTLARMIAQRQQQLTYPLRWWSYGPFWRYEAPQKGRTREFFQWNIDLIGIDSPQADAELVAVVASFLQEVGLTPEEVVILVNDRGMVNRHLVEFNVDDDIRPDVLSWMDRRDKLSPTDWEAYGLEAGLRPDQLTSLKEKMNDPDLWKESETLVQVFEAVKALGISDYVRYDPNIIRGLPYYTGIVFEAFDVSGSVRRSVLGGGRYDNLMAAVGGDPLPAVGFAMGDLVISLILEELGRLPKGRSDSSAEILVTVFSEDGLNESLSMSAELRRAGLKTAIYPETSKLGKQFKYADRMGMKVAVVIGPDEAANKQVSIKNLVNGSQETIARADAPSRIEEILRSE